MINGGAPSLNLIHHSCMILCGFSGWCLSGQYSQCVLKVVLLWPHAQLSSCTVNKSSRTLGWMSAYRPPGGGRWPVSQSVTCPHYSTMTLFAAELIQVQPVLGQLREAAPEVTCKVRSDAGITVPQTSSKSTDTSLAPTQTLAGSL